MRFDLTGRERRGEIREGMCLRIMLYSCSGLQLSFYLQNIKFRAHCFSWGFGPVSVWKSKVYLRILTRDPPLLHPGDIFKFWFLPLVSARAMLGCVCAQSCTFLMLIQSRPAWHCRHLWQSGWLAELGNNLWTCLACSHEAEPLAQRTALPVFLWLWAPGSLFLTKQPAHDASKIVFLFVDDVRKVRKWNNKNILLNVTSNICTATYIFFLA